MTETKLKKQVFETVSSILRSLTGFKQDIDCSTRLYHDAGLCGDDTSEFVQEIKNIFKVDLSEIDGSKFFPSEGDVVIGQITKFIVCIFGGEEKKYEPITVGQIISAIERGDWIGK